MKYLRTHGPELNDAELSAYWLNRAFTRAEYIDDRRAKGVMDEDILTRMQGQIDGFLMAVDDLAGSLKYGAIFRRGVIIK